MAEESVKILRNLMDNGWIVKYGDALVLVRDFSILRTPLGERIGEAALKAQREHEEKKKDGLTIDQQAERLEKVAEDYLTFGW